jgi:anti-anti-sigma factor
MAKIKSGTNLIPVAAEENGVVTVEIEGEIDLHNSPELRDALLGVLLPHATKKLILNLARVPYMDSSAIAVFVEALQKLRPVGGTIRLTNLQPRVRGLLEIARLDAIFEMEKKA